MEKTIKILTALGVIFAGIGETLKNYASIQKSLSDNPKQESNKANDYKSEGGNKQSHS